ncbi:MAG: metallophosphoesterase family protein [Chloroflexota bacterium]
MRVLVISDIHANLVALEAVLADTGTVDEVWCLGDTVGYGPDPNGCVERLRGIPNLGLCVAGNHDAAVLGDMPFVEFNHDARRSLEWQREALTGENADFLRSLPTSKQVCGDVTIAHGSPRDPTWEYILNTLAARLNFEAFDTDFCFVGHSHVQSIFYYNKERDRISLDVPREGKLIELKPRTIINPGSVGQPRDRDPRSAYAIYDSESRTWESRRVVYDIPAVQREIIAAGLPERHALRLAEGW